MPPKVKVVDQNDAKVYKNVAVVSLSRSSLVRARSPLRSTQSDLRQVAARKGQRERGQRR